MYFGLRSSETSCHCAADGAGGVPCNTWSTGAALAPSLKSRTADLGILDLAAQWHEGPVWGSCAAATVILAKVRNGPAPHPRPWFLPSAKRIRGGAARDFSSVWPFHRGIHPEATCAGSAEISTHFQGLAQPVLRERWIPNGIHGIHPEESRDCGSHSRNPPSPGPARRY